MSESSDAPNAQLYERVQRVMSQPHRKRNLRGQTKVALDVLPGELQRWLACMFVEHALEPLINRKSSEYRGAFEGCIEAIRGAMRGESGLEEVRKKEREAIEHSTAKWSHDDGTEYISIGKDGGLLRTLIHCCLQREMEETGLLHRSRYQPSVSKLSDSICHMVAHHAGGEDWNSRDLSLRKKARERGKKASEEEARWQQARIIESLRD